MITLPYAQSLITTISLSVPNYLFLFPSIQSAGEFRMFDNDESLVGRRRNHRRRALAKRVLGVRADDHARVARGVDALKTPLRLFHFARKWMAQRVFPRDFDPTGSGKIHDARNFKIL